jgi:PLD-like domain
MPQDYQVHGANDKALFNLTVHRGEGMLLLAMDWKMGKPPLSFAGFAIEYKEPGGAAFFAVKNRICFPGSEKEPDGLRLTTLRSPIQKFRWVHFPRNAQKTGPFTYRVTPVFMNEQDELSCGDPQTADIELRNDTYPGQLNVAFTRGFVSSQAFIDKYGPAEIFATLIPAKADDGPTFVPTHPKAKEALEWMGFESRDVILEGLDEAVKDKTAQVRVIAYDLNEPEIISRLAKLGKRLKIIIDDSGSHKPGTSGESQAEATLVASAGRDQVKRQHMGQLEHNKTIAVTGKVNKAVCGSTNFSWRGLFVQSNNAIAVQGVKSIQPFLDSFENFWNHSNDVAGFAGTDSAKWNTLNLDGIDAKVAFSPHSSSNALLDVIAKDTEKTTSSLFFSLAFLYQTPGAMKDAIIKVTNKDNVFVYGISDKEVGGLDVKTPNGNEPVTAPAALTGNSVPEPFRSEPTGGAGVRMHHKFLVIDFDKPTARVYMGSYNFSVTADTKNGENLLCIRDRKVATAYMVEAVRIFDHYQFRVAQQKAETAKTNLALAKPPRAKGELPWWDKYYTDPLYMRDRKLFAGS